MFAERLHLLPADSLTSMSGWHRLWRPGNPDGHAERTPRHVHTPVASLPPSHGTQVIRPHLEVGWCTLSLLRTRRETSLCGGGTPLAHGRLTMVFFLGVQVLGPLTSGCMSALEKQVPLPHPHAQRVRDAL